jgi:outer membrane protein OmpA-like peptidoglycan-associated protein
MNYSPFLMRILLGAFVCCMSLSLSAQSPAERKANRLFENFAYADAIELYEYVLKKNPENQQIIRNLAESYRKTNQPRKAAPLLKRVIEMGSPQNEDYLHLAQALETVGDNEEAATYFTKYDQLMASDKRGSRYAESIKSFKSYFDESDNYTFENAVFNTKSSDFSVTPFNEGYLIVSNGNQKTFSLSHAPWNNQRWFDLYTVNPSGEPKARKLSRKVNTRYHEGPACYSKDRKLLAFTRNSVHKGKVNRSSDHVNKLSIFFASPGGKDFKDVQPFPFNNKEYSCGHPAFSSKGDKLYFASDKPGGFGGTDIYVSNWENGAWTEPVNLGPTINTEGNELFPVVYQDSLLTFASNGWGGMGGLDVFYAEFTKDGFKQAINPGSPINSTNDDFSWLILSGAKTGYFSSDRPDGKGGDDVYFYTYKPVASLFTIVDAKSGKPITGAKIRVFKDSVEVASAGTDGKGQSRLILKPCNSYWAVVEASNYPNHKKSITLDCPLRANSEVKIQLKRPELTVYAFDKYRNIDMPEAVLTLVDLTDATRENGLGLTDSKGEAKFDLLPCHEYEINLEKKGVPSVKGSFRAPCREDEKDVEIRLGTGVAPLRGVLVKLKVLEEQNGDPINNARIRLFNTETQEIIEVMTDQSGMYETVLKEGTSWMVNSSRIGYFSTSKSKSSFDVKKGSRTIQVDLKLLQLREGGIIALEGIFYDLNKSDVRPDAAKVLDYVVVVMEENPGLKIELGSHTDSQGSDAYNLTLSEGRAASAEAYIISKGVDKSRITGKGYGETRLKNKCANGVKCPDSLHQENRRTEIRILDFD